MGEALTLPRCSTGAETPAHSPVTPYDGDHGQGSQHEYRKRNYFQN